MHNMNFLGIDPDLHTLAWAYVDETLKPTHVGVIRAPKSQNQVLAMIRAIGDFQPFISRVACAVESQELYVGNDASPRDILHLAQVAGAAAGWFISPSMYFPRPSEWKGQVDKLAHQKKVLAKAGISSYEIMGGRNPYCRPAMPASCNGTEQLNESDYKHVVDAIGLAQYAAETYLFERRKQELLKEARSLP